jgi:signal transduction histidine kinase
VPAELDLNLDQRLPQSVEVTAYYVVVEALTNTARHADASHVVVTAESNSARLRLVIRDNGVGGANPTKGSGLVGLRDRVEALGGTIEVISHLGDGTQITVNIPVEAPLQD